MKYFYLILLNLSNLHSILTDETKSPQLFFNDRDLINEIHDVTDHTKYFLPNTSVPHHYDIGLNLYMGPVDFNYMGYVAINVSVYETVNHLVLHSHGHKIILDFSSVKNDSNLIKIVNVSQNEKNDFLTLHLEDFIIPGKYVILITFEARYFEGAGLVLRSYEDFNGNGKKHLVVSHCEPVYARRILPCYDEPNLKATFRLVIFHPKEYQAISNAEIESVGISTFENKTQTLFQVTPKMSTYLLALSVLDVSVIETSYRDVKIKFFYQPVFVHYSQLVSDATRDSLEYFEKLLKVKYSFNKLDSVMIPHFPVAMENWGLIVYGAEKLILDSRKHTDNDRIMKISEIVCHEVAHQWFGNLVTLDWWDYSWLNEGFATYYMNLCSDSIHGNNDTRRFLLRHVIIMQQILASESIKQINSKSLNDHVEIPSETLKKFETYDYLRGSAMIRFMSMYIPNFQDGVTKYLQQNQFGNVKPIQLFNAMQDVTSLSKDLKVAEIMKNWIEKPGIPLVTFNIVQRGFLSKIIISQERFLIDRNVVEKSNDKWWIPLTLVAEKYANFDIVQPFHWMRPNEDNITINLFGIEDGWIIANSQAGVFCRVNYDLENWRRLIKFLNGPNYQKIHLLNRAQLITDANYLAKGGLLPEHIVLELLLYLKQETDQLVHKAAKIVIIRYGRLLRNEKLFPKYKAFVEEIYGLERANILLAPPNLKHLTKKAFLAFAAQKEISDFEAMEEITEYLYSDLDFAQVRDSVDLGKSVISPKNQFDFITNMERRFEMNQLIQKNFNKADVDEWLNTRYK